MNNAKIKGKINTGNLAMKTQRAPQLATSRTGTIDGSGSVTKDKYPALVANKEAILNAGAAEAFAKLMGMSINEFNAIYAPKGAETKVVDGVVHAASGIGVFGDADPEKHAVAESIAQGIKDAATNPINSAGRATGTLVDTVKYLGERMGEGAAAAQIDTANALSNASNKFSSGFNESAPAITPTNPVITPPTPSILPSTNQISTPKTEAANKDVVGLQPIVATDEQQHKKSTAPSLLQAAKISNPNKLDYEAMPAGFTKQVQKNGNISYSDRPMTTADSPVPLLDGGGTPQSRYAIQQGLTPVQSEAEWNSQQSPSIITPEIQLRMQQGLPITGTSQPSSPTVAVQPPVNNLLAGNQPRPKYDAKVASAEADSRDLSQRQMANDTPNTGGGTGQGGSVGMGGEGEQVAPAQKTEAPKKADEFNAGNTAPLITGQPSTTQQAKKPQQQQTEVPPSIQNGRIAQTAPQLLTPPEPQPAQRGFVAPQIQGILSAENQAALNEQVSRNLATMSRGTGNMSDALATKYAQKSMDTILGKDTQDRAAGQANNNQAQDESQYQRTAKQKASEEAWNQLLQSDASNYGKLKDQRATESAQQNAQAESSKAQLEQFNKDKDRDVKLDTPVKVGENEDGSVIYKSPRQVMQERNQAAANENIKKLQYAAENEKDPNRRQQAIDALNKLTAGQQ